MAHKTRATNQSRLQPHGLLKPEEAARAFKLTLYAAHPELQEWIEYYWEVSWDLGDRHFIQTVITNPTIDLSFEDDEPENGDRSSVVATGVVPQSYQRFLRGQAQVFAVHFLPGMFRHWWGSSVNELTGQAIKLEGASALRPWQLPALTMAAELLALPSADRVKRMDDFLREHRPKTDPVQKEIRKLVTHARNERRLWDPQAMADVRSVSARTNQRQFLEYVGVGPKWIARRYRIQAAVDILDAERQGQTPQRSLTDLALELGYYDHAHFTRDFTLVCGVSPDSYRSKPA